MQTIIDTVTALRDHVASGKLKALGITTLKPQLLQLGLEPAGGTPDALAAFETSERAKWAPVIKAAGLKGD